MNSIIDDHIDKCRCCLKTVDRSFKGSKITDEIRKQFFEIVQVELISSELYSSVICYFCKKRLEIALETRKVFSETQKKLYQHVTEQQTIKSEPVDDCEPIQYLDGYEISKVDPFRIQNLKEEEDEKIVVKVEAPDFDEVWIGPQGNQWETGPEIQIHENKSSNDSKTKSDLKIVPDFNRNAGHSGHKLCPYCGLSFQPNAYSKHITSHSLKINNVIRFCDLCDYKSHSKRYLARHMYRHISNESKTVFECEFCYKICYKLQNLKSHIKNIHQERIPQDPVACKICHKIFKTKEAMYNHVSQKHRFRIVPCTQCDKTFNSSECKRIHFEYVHAPKSPCDICGKMVGPGTALRRHKLRYHREKIQCPVEGCGKFYPNTNSLRIHTLHQHIEEEGLKCPECDAEFKNSYRLKVHIRRQHGTEKRPCQVPGCSHTTTRRAYMVMHYRNHKNISAEDKERLIAELKSKKF